MRSLSFVIFVLCALPALALNVEQPLPDAAQEARARALFQEFRCLVCQGESIADSPAELAVDLRAAVRSMVEHRQTDADIRKALVAQYGEVVLMRPPFSARTVWLWLGPFIMGAVGVAVLGAYFGLVRVGRR